MSGSGWLGKIKSGAKSMQQTAQNRLEKLSQTLDDKIKEARDDLEKQRQAEVAAAATAKAPVVQRWRPSSDNPDGEIVAEVKPIPIVQPVVQPSLATSPPPLSATLPEIPEVPVAVEEPITIPRKLKDKRRATKTSENKNIPNKQIDPNEEHALSISTATPTLISQEMINNDSNAIKDHQTTNKVLTDSASVITTVENEKAVPSTNDSPEEIVRIHPTTNVSNSSLEQSDLQTTVIDKPNNEQPPQTVTELPVAEDSKSIQTHRDASNDQELAAKNIIDTTVYQPDPIETTDAGDLSASDSKPIDETSVEQWTPENTMANISGYEPNIEEPLNDKTPALIDVIELPTVDAKVDFTSDNATTDEIPDNALSSVANIEEPTTKQSDLVETSDDIAPRITDTADLPSGGDTTAQNIQVNTSTHNVAASIYDDEILEENWSTVNKTKDTSDYQVSATTNIEEPPSKQPDLIEVPYEMLPRADVQMENIATDTQFDKVVSVYDDEIPEDQSTLQDTTANTKIDELTSSIYNDDIPEDQSTLQDTTTNEKIEKITPSIYDDEISEEPTALQDITANRKIDEVTPSIYDDEIPEDQSTLQDITTNTKIDDMTPSIYDYEVSEEPTTLQDTTANTKIDEVTPSIYDDEIPEEPTALQDITANTKIDEVTPSIYDDEIPEDQSTLQDITTTTKIDDVTPSIYDDEISEEPTTLQDTTANTKIDEVTPSIYDDEIPEDQSTLQDTTTNTKIDEVTPSIYDDEIPEDQSTLQDTTTTTKIGEVTPSIYDEEIPEEQSTLKNATTNTKIDEMIPSIYDDEILDYEASTKESHPQASNDELLFQTENDKSPIKQTNSENTQAKSSDDAVANDLTQKQTVRNEATDYTSLKENISTDTSTDTGKAYSRLETISLDISDDEVLTTAIVTNSPSLHSVSENYSVSTSDEDSATSKSDQEKNLLAASDDQLPTSDATIDLLNTNSTFETISIDTLDDDSPTIDSTEENFQMILTDAKLPTSTKLDEMPIIQSLPENRVNNIQDDDDDYHDELPKSTPTKNAYIEQANLKEKLTTLINDLEDSFEELKAADIPVQRAPTPPPPPSQETPQLTSIRELIAKIEVDDDDGDNIFLSSKPKKIVIPENKISIEVKPAGPPKVHQTRLSSSSDSDDAPDDLFGIASAPSHATNDVASTDNTTESPSIASTQSKLIEKKHTPIVNSHSIPTGAKLLHVACSSTYIYLCTTDKKIFYTKFNPENLNGPYKWQQHTDVAEQLFVSHSNQTVWRYHSKTLYAANDPLKSPPFGSSWNKIKLDDDSSYLSISINDQCGWYIKNDRTLWFVRINDRTYQPTNVACPFNLDRVFCFGEKVGVSTSDDQILIRTGCTNDLPEGAGWSFIEPNLGVLDDFVILTNNDTVVVVDEKHRLWMHQWNNDTGFYQILCDDDFYTSNERHLVSVNSNVLCFTNCKNQIHLFSECLAGAQWITVKKNTRFQRLIGAFSDEDYVWVLTTDRQISSSNGRELIKPRQVESITHATLVPNNSSKNTILWSLDKFCGVYVRPDLEQNTEWEQANQIQFSANQRLINIVCNNAGVWAVDDRGHVYFRHGHISASQSVRKYGESFLPPAWIEVPGEPERRRSFTQVYCGPVDWMVYATDNKQTVYTRVGINEENRIGSAWKAIEDCSALELALSEHTLWLLTSMGEIQCRTNISLSNPIGTQSTTLSGRFLSLTVSMDDSQVWALDSQRNLLKLDRLTVAFEK